MITKVNPMTEVAQQPHEANDLEQPVFSEAASAEPSYLKAAEAAVAKWAAGVRDSFGRGNRKDFNFAVCDALAAAGLQPTAFAVLRLGHWGNAASIAQDVADWYKTLATRLTSLESSIPLPARRQANALLDKLFEVAKESSHTELQALLEPLQAELGATKGTLNETLESERAQALRSQELEQALQALRAKLDESDAQMAELQAGLRAAAVKEQELDFSLMTLGANFNEQAILHERENAQHRLDLSALKETHANELLKARDTADAERRRLMLASDGLRVEYDKRIKELQGEIEAGRVRQEALRTEQSQLAVALSTAQTSLAGAQELLASERAHFADKETLYKGEEYRHRSLVNFAAQGRMAGISIYLAEEERQNAAGWLSNMLDMSSVLAGGITQNMQVKPVVPANVATTPKKAGR